MWDPPQARFYGRSQNLEAEVSRGWRDRGSGIHRQKAGYTYLEDLEALGETHTAGLYLEL